MGQDFLHVKKGSGGGNGRHAEKEFSTLSRFMFHLLTMLLFCLWFPWWWQENKGQGSTPQFQFLVMALNLGCCISLGSLYHAFSACYMLLETW